MTNKILCDQCQDFVRHTIATVVDDKVVTRRLCEGHYFELKKQQWLDRFKGWGAKLLEAMKTSKLPSPKTQQPPE